MFHFNTTPITILLLFLPIFILSQVCTTGHNYQYCTQCDSSQNCLSCQLAYSTYQDRCYSCVITNCQTCYLSTYNATHYQASCLTCGGASGRNQIGLCTNCNGANCLSCPQNYLICKSCDNSSKTGLFEYNTGTVSCIACLANCQSCLNDASLCTQCQTGSGFSLISNRTVCQICAYPCSQCLTSGNQKCTSCISGFYIEGQECIPCNFHCQICLNGDSCEQCDNQTLLDNGNSVCYKQVQFCQTYKLNSLKKTNECKSCAESYVIVEGISPQIPTCVQICGDNLKFTYLCDNDIGIQYDGCNEICSIENGFVCRDGANDVRLSVCSYEKVLEMEVKQIKFGNSNSLQVKVKVSIGLHVLKTSNLKKVFGISMNQKVKITQVSSFNPQNNQIDFVIEFYQDLIDVNISILFQPSESIDERYFQTPQSSAKFHIGKAIFYSQLALNARNFIPILCYIIICFGWINIAFGLIIKRLSGVQTMIVFQIAWLSMLWLQAPLYVPLAATFPLKNLVFPKINFLTNTSSNTSNSVTNSETFLSASIRISEQNPHLSNFGIQSVEFANNFNLCLCLSILWFIIYVITSIIIVLFRNKLKSILMLSQGEVPFSDEYGQSQYQIIKKRSFIFEKLKQISCQCLLCFQILNIPNFLNSLFLFFRYSMSIWELKNIILLCLSALLYLLTLICFCYDPDPFDYFRYSFKKQRLAIGHFYIYSFVFISCILMILLLPNYTWAPMIPFSCLLIHVLIYKPFKQPTQNYHSAFSSVVVLVVLGFRVFGNYCKKINSIEANIYLVTLIFFMVLLGALTLVMFIYRVVFLCYLRPQTQKHGRQRVLFQLDDADVVQKGKRIEDENNIFKKMILDQMNILDFSNRIKFMADTNDDDEMQKNDSFFKNNTRSNFLTNCCKEDAERGKKLRRQLLLQRIENKNRKQKIIVEKYEQDSGFSERQIEKQIQQEQKIVENIQKNFAEYLKNIQQIDCPNNENLTTQQIEQKNRKMYALQIAVEENNYVKLKSAEQFAQKHMRIKNKDEQTFMNEFNKIQ